MCDIQNIDILGNYPLTLNKYKVSTDKSLHARHRRADAFAFEKAEMILDIHCEMPACRGVVTALAASGRV